MSSAGIAIFLTLVAIQVTNGSPPRGRCPQPQLQQQFDMNKFLGRWYTIENNRHPGQREPSECINGDYFKSTNGGDYPYSFVHSSSRQGNPRQSSIGGTLSVPDPKEPAYMIIRYNVPKANAGSYQIVSTDYNTYAVVWSCNDSVQTTNDLQFLWIMSRQPTLDSNTLSTIRSQLSQNNLDTSKLVTIKQTGCQYPPPPPK